MKKRALRFFFSVFFSLIIVSCITIAIYNCKINRNNERQLLSFADSVVSEDVIENKRNDDKYETDNETFSVEKLEADNNIVGKIVIDKIDVNAPILDGTDQETLKIAVGHFSSSGYWKGNVCLASHNRGSYAHYFEKINKLNIGDEIKYQTKLGTRIYKVSQIKNISEEDLSVLENTKDNTITLITCVKSQPELRLCVKGIEK
ncbi:MAG: class D sortase [Clostridia bacterium]|nr:class D sortase [Clostridia bacterium]